MNLKSQKFGLGIFLGRLDCTPLILYKNWLIFGVLIYWHLLPTVRNGFAVLTKPAVFTLIVFFIWLLFRRFFPASTPRGKVRSRTAPELPSRSEIKTSPDVRF